MKDKRKQLREEQTTKVMPLIGPLLDAWEMLYNDIKSQIVESSMLGHYLDEISKAMEYHNHSTQ